MRHDVTIEHAALTKRREHARDVEVRANDELGRRIVVADVGEQEQRQESPPTAAYVGPPCAVDVVAAIDVPARIAGIAQAGEPDGKRPTDPFASDPAAGAEELVVRRPKCR